MQTAVGPLLYLCFFFAIDVVRSKFYQRTDVDPSIRGILRSVVRQDAIIRIQGRDTDEKMKRLLEIVSQTVTTSWPSQISIFGETRGRDQPRNASSATVLIYVYAPSEAFGYGKLNVMLDEVRLMSHPKHLPKLFLILVSGSRGKRALSAQRQLEYLWERGFFDVVALEVTFQSGQRPLQPVFVAVHLFNGFSKNYSKLTAYQSVTDWYPNKLRNMHGGKLKVMFKAARPYGTLDPESGEFGGLAGVVANTLSVIANATMVLDSRSSRNSDLVYDAKVLVHTYAYRASYEHTVAIDNDRICLLLPLSDKRVLVDFSQIVVTILIGLLLTVIAWFASRALKISKRIHGLMNTFSLLLCISPSRKPRTLLEKAMFVVVMMTAVEYTTIFQMKLFQFAIEYIDDRHIASFKELSKIGLTSLVLPTVYKKIWTMEAMLPVSPGKVWSVEFQDDHSELNTSKAYFLPEIDGKVAEFTNVDENDGRLFKLYDFCDMSLNRVHTLPVRSPYKDEINRALLLLAENGIANKYLDKFWEREGARSAENEKKFSIDDHSMYTAFLVILTGHAMSLIVFVGELAVGVLRARKRSIRAVKHSTVSTEAAKRNSHSSDYFA